MSTLLLILLLALYCYDAVLRPWPDIPRRPSDFEHYYLAARNLLAGQSPFTVPGYDYPAILSFVFAPLALLSYEAARWTWFLASHACILASAWLVWRATGRTIPGLLAVALIFATGEASYETLALGQVTPLLVLLVTLALLQHKAGAAALGSAVAIKLIPAPASLTYLLRRDLRALLVSVAFALTLLLAPLAILRATYPPPYTPSELGIWRGTPHLLSTSLPSIALRFVDAPQSTGPLPAYWQAGNTANTRIPDAQARISLSVAAVTLILGSLLLTLRTRLRLQPTQHPYAVSALIALALLGSPLSWTHYQLFAYPGVAWMLAYALQQQRMREAAAIFFAFLCLYRIPVAGLRAYLTVHGWTAADPTLLYFWSSLPALAGIALFLLALRHIQPAQKAA